MRKFRLFRNIRFSARHRFISIVPSIGKLGKTDRFFPTLLISGMIRVTKGARSRLVERRRTAGI